MRKSFTARLAERVLRSINACVFCGVKHLGIYPDRQVKAILEVEHIVPVSRGGTNDPSNLTVACRRCNRKKGTKTAHEFGFPNVTTAADAFGRE
jgi:5-methylcytosine-specific restriction endonuclease McrA